MLAKKITIRTAPVALGNSNDLTSEIFTALSKFYYDYAQVCIVHRCCLFAAPYKLILSGLRSLVPLGSINPDWSAVIHMSSPSLLTLMYRGPEVRISS